MQFPHILLAISLIALVIGLFSKKGTEADRLGESAFILLIYSGLVKGFHMLYTFLVGS